MIYDKYFISALHDQPLYNHSINTFGIKSYLVLSCTRTHCNAHTHTYTFILCNIECEDMTSMNLFKVLKFGKRQNSSARSFVLLRRVSMDRRWFCGAVITNTTTSHRGNIIDVNLSKNLLPLNTFYSFFILLEVQILLPHRVSLESSFYMLNKLHKSFIILITRRKCFR